MGWERARQSVRSSICDPVGTRRTLLIAAFALMLGAAAALLAGCGSSAASASSAPSASEQAQTRAFADSINLSTHDLSGFKVVLEAEGRSGPLDHSIEECDGGPIFNQANHGVASPLLQRGKVQTLSSEVYRTPSPSFASIYIKAAGSTRGLGCVQRAAPRGASPIGSGSRPAPTS